mmetsp:Transcript_14160/g.38760  ORF Transcript_14160/g.38760 Transcript_14160/m.38760 type:complete len:83 (-) Transcript_14160:8-256(-)
MVPQQQPPTKPHGQVFVKSLMSPTTVHGQQTVRTQRPQPPGAAQHSHKPVEKGIAVNGCEGGAFVACESVATEQVCRRPRVT